jgi:LytTr DNA-binding domain
MAMTGLTSRSEMLLSQVRGWLSRDNLLFYVVVPLAFGLVVGWLQPSRSAAWSKFPAVYYWVVGFIVGWALFGIGTQIARIVLRPWNPPFLLLLFVGWALANMPAGYFARYHISATYEIFEDLPRAPIPPMPSFSRELLSGNFFDDNFVGFVLWLSINAFFVYVLGIPRFGHGARAAKAEAQDTGPPAFLARIKPELGSTVLALAAEQHYLRVYTTLGSDLILYRFADAVRELGGRGVQVHRSYWVAKDAGASTEIDATKAQIVLKNGLKVPVSRTYKMAARQVGLL